VSDCSSFIGGRFVPGTSGVVLDNLNPATGERIGGIELAGPAEVEQAVAAAARGFAQWSAMTGSERGRILNRAAAIVRARARALARLEVIDTGKPIQEAEAVDVPSAADCIEFFAGRSCTPGASRSASAPGSAPGTIRCRSRAGSRPPRSPAATR
jgi:betaine-aldehyde dehydrogenase